MPQRPILSLSFNQLLRKQEDKPDMSLFQIEFDPTITADGGKSIYGLVFDEFETLYKDVTGNSVDLTKGRRKVRTFDREFDKSANHDYSLFKQRAMDVANENPQFRTALSKGQKEEFADTWAKEAFGMFDYMASNMPPKNTVEGKTMRKQYGKIIDNAFNGHLSRMIRQDALMTADFHSVDSWGDFWKQRIGSTKKMAGTAIQAQTDLLAGLLSGPDPQYSGARLARHGEVDNIDYDKETQKIATNIFNYGAMLETEGEEQYQAAAPPSGRFAQPVEDRGWSALWDLGYMVHKGTESIGSQAITTGPAIAGSMAMQLSPWARGAGVITRAALGLAGATPGLATGYAVESGDAYASARDWLRDLRLKAEAEQSSIDSGKSKLTQEQFDGIYGVALSENLTRTANKLDDNDIHRISVEIGNSYAALATGVEALSTSLQSGVVVRAGAKMLGVTLGKKGAEAAAGKAIASRIGRNIMATGGAALKNIPIEGITEGIQEFIQEDIQSKRLPLRRKNMSAVYNATYAGAAMGGGTTAVTALPVAIAGHRRVVTKEEAIAKAEKQLDKDFKKGKHTTAFDAAIIGGKLLGLSPHEIADNIATPGKEGKSTRTMILARFAEIQNKIHDIMDNPSHAMNFIKKNKEDLEGFYNLTETTLQNLMLQPAQIAEILGVDVKDLKNQKAVPFKQRKKLVTRKEKEEDAIRGIVDQKDLEDPTVNMAQDPSSQQSLLDLIDGDNNIVDPAEQIGLVEEATLAAAKQALKDALDGTDTRVNSMTKGEREDYVSRLQDEISTLSPKKSAKPAPTATGILEPLPEGESITSEEQVMGLMDVEGMALHLEDKMTKKELLDLAKSIDVATAPDDRFMESTVAKSSLDKKGLSELVAFQLSETVIITGEPEISKDIEEEMSFILDYIKRDGPKKISIKESGANVAKNLAAMTNQVFEGGVALPQDILEDISDEALINHAKQVLVPVQDFLDDADHIMSKTDLIQAILDKQGPLELQGGFGIVGIKEKNLTKLKRLFRQGWYQTLQGSEIESSEGLFRKWVEEYVGPFLPEHYREHFYDWANDFNPEQTIAGEFAFAVYDKLVGKPKLSKTFESDVKDFEAVAKDGADKLTENIWQQDTEGSDIHTENYTHLNSQFFEGIGVTLKKDVIEELESLAENTDNFEDFVKQMSDPKYGLISEEGMTPVDLVNQKHPLGRKLKQFYVGNLPENNIRVNDGKLGEGESSRTKEVSVSINSDSRGWGPIVYKNRTKKARGKKEIKKGWTGNARATMANRFIDVPIIWLNGSDVTKTQKPIKLPNGNQIFPHDPIYGFLSSEDLKEITSSKLVNKSLVPLFIKGDADRIGLIEITEGQKALDPERYWRGEIKRDPTLKKIKIDGVIVRHADNYLGEKISDDDMSAAYGSPELYKAAGIARHEAFKEILGEDYHRLSGHKIMHRLKILFTPATTRTGGRNSLVKLVSLDEATKGKKKFISKTYYEGGEIQEKNLIKTMNNTLQYVGDGMTLTSERVFLEKYPDEVGASPIAKRAKTVKVVRDGSGTLLMKHQEMSFNLPDNATHTDIISGNEKVAEIRREKGQVNIYVDDGSGNFNRYVDHLATTDEAKVTLGDFSNFDEVHEIPSEATGHIMFTEADKQKAPFPMQVTNYINDPGFLNALNTLLTDPDTEGQWENKGSAAKVLAHMVKISQGAKYFDEFLEQVKSKHPDSLPRMIIEMARMGAGFHPSQLDYGQVLVKNRLFSQAMDVKQEGGVLDFRPNLVSDIDKGNIVLPFQGEIQKTVARKLENLTKHDYTQIMNMSRSDLNQLLKDNPVKILLVRHPVPSRAGYKVLTVERFDPGIGDSFMINDEDVKEVFEGDFDHDTGHISILPHYMQTQMILNEVKQNELKALDLEKYAKGIDSPSISSLEGSVDLMAEMAFGQASVGEIANVQRVAGIGQVSFNSIEIDGKLVKMRSLDSEVLDPDIGDKMSIEQLLRHYAQAAFDNVSLRLLKHWNYSQEKLYRMLFFNSDGSELSDVQFQVLNQSIIKIMKMTQAIKKGEQTGKALKLQELMEMSEQYLLFSQDRAGYIREFVKQGRVRIETEKDGKIKTEKRGVSQYIGKIDMNEELHPHERLAIMPRQYLNHQHVTLDNFFKVDDLKSKLIHNRVFRDLNTKFGRLNNILDALGKTSLDQISEEQQQQVLKEIRSGEQWGSQMRNEMNLAYQGIETNEKGQDTGKIANSMTWDYNPEFVEFVDKWLDGFPRDDGKHNKGYNELTEVERVTATMQFLEGIYDARDGMTKFNVRKIPPVSKRQGESLLHPGIMQEYFTKYNEYLGDPKLMKDYNKIVPVNHTYEKTMKEFFGCE